jgi:hypothetical protein
VPPYSSKRSAQPHPEQDADGHDTGATEGHDYEDHDDGGPVNGPTDLAQVELARTQYKRYDVTELAAKLNVPDFPKLIQRFLYDQLHPNGPLTSSDVPLSACPYFDGKVTVFLSAVATYYAPSDHSGIGGMRRERIRATHSWQKGAPRYDCMLLNTNPDLPGMRGLDVVRVLQFFSFKFRGITYPCALVRWFSRVGDEPDEDTGMWMVRPMSDADGAISVIHLDCVVRAAHLVPVYGDDFIPPRFPFHVTLDCFYVYYVSKYADHHMFDTVS